METIAAAKLSTPQQWMGSTLNSETNTEKDQFSSVHQPFKIRTGNFRGRLSRTFSISLLKTVKSETETKRNGGCFSSMITRSVTRRRCVRLRVQVRCNNLPENKAGSETTATNSNASNSTTNSIQIWSPARKTTIGIPSHASDRKAYSLAMKAYILNHKQLYDLSKGKSLEGINTSRIDLNDLNDLNDLKGKKSWDLQSVHRMREGWICELRRHLSSEPAS